MTVGGVTIPLFRDISVSAIFFLFHTQLMLCLLENVYLLDYMQLRLDEKVAALLSIFTPIFFLGFFCLSGVYHLYVTSRVRLVSGVLMLLLRAIAFFFTGPYLKLILSSLGMLFPFSHLVFRYWLFLALLSRHNLHYFQEEC